MAMLAFAPGCAARGQVHTVPTSTPVRELRAQLAQVFGAPLMARGVWGADVRSLDTGERLYQLNAGKLMMPASNMKIVTVSAAAEALGWEFRFNTSLETAALVDDGVLRGDLFIRGNGDPTINARANRADAVFDELAAGLREAGVREVRGRIIGDDTAFDDDGIGPGWSWDYLEAGYAAPSGALQYNENIAALTVTPGAAAGNSVGIDLPPGTGLTVVSRAVTGDVGSAATLRIVRRIDGPVIEVAGSVPAGGQPVRRTVAVANPTVYLAQALKDALIARGIFVTGEAMDLDDAGAALAPATAARRVLVTAYSPPLREIATVLMKVSQNLYAETLLKALGATRNEVGTTRGGLEVVRETLASWRVPDDGYIMADGSGLSRYNYLAPETITAVLERMYRDLRHRDAFSATLPIAGTDGTIASRLRRSRAEGNLIAKTGSIANVRSLSGYVRTRDGERLVFAVLANDFVIPSASVTWVADLAVEILSNFTRH